MMHREVVPDKTLTRRAFSVGVGGVAVLGWADAVAGASAPNAAGGFAEALARVLGSTRPVEGPIAFDIPEYAENGMMVSYTVSVDSPMTEENFVRAIHLLSSANIKPVLSVFRLSPASGKATVSGRVRLAKTQRVYAVAELNDGRVLLSEKLVNVTVGSCG